MSKRNFQYRGVKQEVMSNSFTKFHLKGFPFDGVFHRFTAPDKGDPHDHPFAFTTFITKGSYTERVWNTDRGTYSDRTRSEGDAFRITASTVHQIIALPHGECWTFILPEKWERKPGFYKFGDVTLHRFWDEKEFKPMVASNAQVADFA